LHRYHIAGADAEKIAMLEIKREPFGNIRDAIITTAMIQNCTYGDGGRHDTVAWTLGGRES